MSFALFTSFDAPYKPVAARTLPVLTEYCLRHGYELNVRINPSCERGIIWNRMNDLSRYRGPHRWLVHVDSDILITNPTIRLEEIIASAQPTGGTLYIVGSDCNGVNDGMMFMSNEVAARASAAAAFVVAPEDCFQTHITQSMTQAIQDGKIVIAPQRLFNSYLKGEYGPNPSDGDWRKGDFALHLPGRSNERRVEILDQMLPQITR